MMFILSALGLATGIILAVVGLSPGGSELERILAIACFAMGAAGFVGLAMDDGIRPPRRSPPHSIGNLFCAIVGAPIALVCLGVFVLTLVPSIWVFLPTLAVWAWISIGRRDHEPSPPHGARLPAYA